MHRSAVGPANGCCDRCYASLFGATPTYLCAIIFVRVVIRVPLALRVIRLRQQPARRNLGGGGSAGVFCLVLLCNLTAGGRRRGSVTRHPLPRRIPGERRPGSVVAGADPGRMNGCQKFVLWWLPPFFRWPTTPTQQPAPATLAQVSTQLIADQPRCIHPSQPQFIARATPLYRLVRTACC